MTKMIANPRTAAALPGYPPIKSAMPRAAGLPKALRDSTRPRRIVFYSHDTQGLGHMRRNQVLAKALLQMEPRPNILLIGGAREMGALQFADGIDCLTLPALHKSVQGEYQPRSLSVSLRRLIELRSNAILGAIQSFDPDLLVVDKVPRGAFGELEPALHWLKVRGRARCVLGLREILDEPKIARREWAADGGDALIERCYSAVWVYGDPKIYDAASEYGFGKAVRKRLVYTGYIDRASESQPIERAELCARLNIPASAQIALCYVGGGQDGFAVAQACAQAPLPANTEMVILAGPLMPAAEREQLHAAQSANPHVHVLDFMEQPEQLLHHADAVISMAGYNSVCEILAFEKRALLVPRVRPRREQLIRAERLHAAGLVDLLLPDKLNPAAIGDWLANLPEAAPASREQIRLDALRMLPELVANLC